MTLRAGREFLAIPGPTTVPDEVLRAMHRPAVDIYAGPLLALTESLHRDIARVFQTQGRAYYSQQSWLTQTIKAAPFTNASISPVLNRAYPTYGKLLADAGYSTPYIGKWHVSIPPPEADRLDAYGFEGLTYYDPTGANLQGTVGDHGNGYLNDQDIAAVPRA